MEKPSSSKPALEKKPIMTTKKKTKNRCGGQKDKARRLKAQDALSKTLVKATLDQAQSSGSSSSEAETEVPDQRDLEIAYSLVNLGSMSRSRQRRLAKRQKLKGHKSGFLLQSEDDDQGHGGAASSSMVAADQGKTDQGQGEESADE